MKKPVKSSLPRKTLIIFLGLLFAGQSFLFGEREMNYDPYLSALKYPEAGQVGAARDRDRNLLFVRILEQPVRPAGYSLGKTAEWIERKRVDDKVVWFFDELS